MSLRFVSALSSVVLLGSLPSTQAEMVHDNGAPDKHDGSEMTYWVQADDFTLSSRTRLDQVKFWNFEIAGFFAGFVTWEIRANTVENKPGALLYSGTSANLTRAFTGFSVYGAFKEYFNQFDISSPVLAPGTYWLALHNGDLANNGSRNFFWETTRSLGSTASHNRVATSNGPWSTNEFPGLPSEFAFQLGGVAEAKINSFAVANGRPVLNFSTINGEDYRVEFKDRLSDVTWDVLPGAESITGTGQNVQVDDRNPPTGAAARRFYRVVLL